MRKSSKAGERIRSRDIKDIPASRSTDDDSYLPEQTFSGSILNRSTPPKTPETAKNFTQFIFDHTFQRRVVPVGAARGSQYGRKRTMNRGGTASTFHIVKPEHELDT